MLHARTHARTDARTHARTHAQCEGRINQTAAAVAAAILCRVVNSVAVTTTQTMNESLLATEQWVLYLVRGGKSRETIYEWITLGKFNYLCLVFVETDQ